MAYFQTRTSADGTTRYRVQIRLKGYPTQSATFTRKTDAKKWAASTESAILEGRHFRTSEAKRRTVGEMIDRYTNEVLPSKSKNTVHTANQRRQLLWWREALGKYSLADLSAPIIAEHRDKLSKGITHLGTPRTPSAVNRFLSAFSTCITHAVREWQWMEDSPMKNVARKPENEGRTRFLDDDERRRLLDACQETNNPFLFPVVMIAISTGARKSEIMTLNWNAVNFEQQKITLFKTKNGETRTLPMVGAALMEMEKLSKVMRIDSQLCFPSQDGKKPFDIRSAWNKALKLADIKDFKFHDLRHSAASYLAMSGCTPSEIAAVLGHRTLSMVARYAHVAEAHTAGVVERMNNKIFGVV